MTTVALWLALRQGYEAARREQARDRASLLHAWSLGNEALTRSEDIGNKIRKASPGKRRAKLLNNRDDFWELNGVIAGLYRFTDGNLPSVKASELFADVRSEVSNFRRSVEDYANAYRREGYPTGDRWISHVDPGEDDYKFKVVRGRNGSMQRVRLTPPRTPDLNSSLDRARLALDQLRAEIVVHDRDHRPRGMRAWLGLS